MSALPKPKPEPVFQLPEREPIILEHMERIARKAGTTIQPDVQAVMAHLTAQALEDGLPAAMKKADMERIRPDAVKTLKANARGWRDEIRKDLVVYIVDGLKRGENATRAELKTKAQHLCAYRNFKGKNKQRIQDATIDKWLSLELEKEIRDEAVKISADSPGKGLNRI